MTEEEVRAEVGTKAIKFIDEHEKDCLTGFEMMRDFAYEVTKDLEKENAELKDDNKVMADNYSKMEQKFYDNLTKAKEIIKNLMVYVPIDLKEYEEANNLLKENSTYERIQKAKYNYTD